MSHIELDELDRELTRPGHRFVRYAVDCNVYVHSERVGHEVVALPRSLEHAGTRRWSNPEPAVAQQRRLISRAEGEGAYPFRRSERLDMRTTPASESASSRSKPEERTTLMPTAPTTSAFSAKEKALVGVALSVATGCRPCTEHYVRAAEAAGACKRGIRLAIESAMMARQQATDAIGSWAEELLGEAPPLDEAFIAPRTLWQAIYSTGAAFAQHDANAVAINANRALALGASKIQLAALLAQSHGVTDRGRKHTQAALSELELAPTSTPTMPGCACDR